MARFNSFHAMKKALRSGLWHECQKLSDPLFIGCVWYFGKGMQAFRHAGKGEEIFAAMIMERTLSQRIPCQEKPTACAIPKSECVVADKTFETRFTPALQRSKK